MTRSRPFVLANLASVVLALVPGVGAWGQAPDGAIEDGPSLQRLERPGPADEMTRRLLGALVYTSVTVQFDATPAREAFQSLCAQLDAPVVGRWWDDPAAGGLDPSTPITLASAVRPAVEVLEEMLAQCEAAQGEPCTWQLRKGFIEYGTKQRLSVPAARELRTYYIADLIMDVDPFGRDGRQRREVLALDLVEDVVKTIEPGAWDYGQDLPDPELDDIVLRLEARAAAGQGHAAAAPAGGASTPDAPAPRQATAPRRYVPPQKVASIRYWRDFIIVSAPDYIHRQLDGYPEPLPPPGPGRTVRSARPGWRGLQIGAAGMKATWRANREKGHSSRSDATWPAARLRRTEDHATR